MSLTGCLRKNHLLFNLHKLSVFILPLLRECQRILVCIQSVIREVLQDDSSYKGYTDSKKKNTLTNDSQSFDVLSVCWQKNV